MATSRMRMTIPLPLPLCAHQLHKNYRAIYQDDTAKATWDARIACTQLLGTSSRHPAAVQKFKLGSTANKLSAQPSNERVDSRVVASLYLSSFRRPKRRLATLDPMYAIISFS